MSLYSHLSAPIDRASDRNFDLLDPRSNHPGQRQALRDWLQLQATLGLAPQDALACLRRAGNPRTALEISGQRAKLRPERLDAAISVLEQRGYRALPITSSLYPAPLAAVSDTAPLLLVAGDPRHLTGGLVAIVGARAATVYGLELARALGARLAQAGVTVVSGLARGIDGAAHRGALEAMGKTIAVQACGPDRVYPAEHRGLAKRIAEQGALLTELPVGTPPRPPYFPLRNRLISGLCSCVIVVEAREKSGSLITARHALDQGRDVMAIPGPITAPTSRGPNRLIRDGATPILDVDDVLEFLGVPLPEAVDDAATPAGEGVGVGGRAILETLANGALSRDELGRKFPDDPRQLDLDLMDLQLQGRVRKDRDGRMVKAMTRNKTKTGGVVP